LRAPRLLSFRDGEEARARLLSYGATAGDAERVIASLREFLLYLPPGFLAGEGVAPLSAVVPLARTDDGSILLSAGRDHAASGSVPGLPGAVSRLRRRFPDLACRDRLLPLGDRPAVMAILNATPDSFSDGGRFDSAEAAVEGGLRMLSEGADLLDVGGESTRPGSLPVPPAEQLARVLPVIRGVLARSPEAILSVDTTNASVAAACLEAGASMVNDTSALADDPAMAGVVRDSGAAVVLMHRRGAPAEMQRAPSYRCFMKEMVEELEERLLAAVDAGIAPERILLDPGIGFGKRVADNLEAHRHLGDLCALGRPVLFASSRKAFLGTIDGEAPAGRLDSSTASALLGAAAGASVVRVHDPAPVRVAMELLAAVRKGESP
jgi:dihydropteroate synthase